MYKAIVCDSHYESSISTPSAIAKTSCVAAQACSKSSPIEITDHDASMFEDHIARMNAYCASTAKQHQDSKYSASPVKKFYSCEYSFSASDRNVLRHQAIFAEKHAPEPVATAYEPIKPNSRRMHCNYRDSRLPRDQFTANYRIKLEKFTKAANYHYMQETAAYKLEDQRRYINGLRATSIYLPIHLHAISQYCELGAFVRKLVNMSFLAIDNETEFFDFRARHTSNFRLNPLTIGLINSNTAKMASKGEDCLNYPDCFAREMAPLMYKIMNMITTQGANPNDYRVTMSIAALSLVFVVTRMWGIKDYSCTLNDIRRVHIFDLPVSVFLHRYITYIQEEVYLFPEIIKAYPKIAMVVARLAKEDSMYKYVYQKLHFIEKDLIPLKIMVEHNQDKIDKEAKLHEYTTLLGVVRAYEAEASQYVL